MNFRQLSSLTETIIRPRPCLLPSTRCWILNGKQQPRLPGSYVPFTRFIQRTENFARGNANASEAGQGHRLSAQARHPFCCGKRDNSVIDAVAWEVGAHNINAGRHGSRGHWSKNDEWTFSAPFFLFRFEFEIEFACSSCSLKFPNEPTSEGSFAESM
jgi:hypothetical protein